MALKVIFYSILITGIFTFVLTKPTDLEKSFSTILNQKCPKLVSETRTSDEGKIIDEKCKEIKVIKNDTKLSKDNVKDVLCSLYQSSIISYCNENENLTLEFSPPNLQKNQNIQEVCDYLMKTNRFGKLLNNNIQCVGLCTSYYEIVPECMFSYYYFNVKPTPQVQITNKSHRNVTVSPSISSEGTVAVHQSGINTILTQSVTKTGSTLTNSVSTGSNTDPASIKPNAAFLESNPDVNNNEVVDNNPVNPPSNVEESSAKDNTSKVISNGDSKETKSQSHISNQNVAIDSPKHDQNQKLTENKIPIVPKPGESPTVPKPGESPKVSKPDESPKVSKPDESPKVSKPDESPKVPKLEETSNNSPTIDVSNSNTPIKSETGEDDINKLKAQIPEENNDTEDNDEQHGEAPEYTDTDVSNVDVNEAVPMPHEEEKTEKKPDTLENSVSNDNMDEIDGQSYFMTYFMVICVMIILGYVGYHNRIKIMALVLEGKRGKRHYRGRRPNSANYRKLDTNLEEAISSNVSKNSNNIIY